MLNRSAEYLAAADALRDAEIALKDQREAVANLRRNLPEGPTLPDYEFAEQGRALDTDDATIMLSSLFREGCDKLAVIHFMYKAEDKAPCPMCSMWADGYNAIEPHVDQHMPMVLIAKAPVPMLASHARNRDWMNLRLLSSGGTSFNRDFGMEDEDGSQMPGFSVLTKSPDGTLRQFYTGCAMFGGDHYRGLDMLSPVWNILDLTPDGRGEWFPGLAYS